MKLLFKLQSLKFLWTLKPPSRAFHGHRRLLSSDVYSQYESIRQGKQEIPKYFNFASDVLDKWSEIEKAGKRPSKPAFWWINGEGEEVKWSFEELGFLSRKVANVLTKECGLQKGDRLILILPRVPEWWLVKVACLRAGIVIIPGTSQLSAKDILYRLQASGAKCIVTTDKLAPAVDSVAPQCQLLKTKLVVSKGSREGWLNFTELYQNQSADHSCIKTRIQDPMIIFFTSGTTGSPKMTQHSQGSLGFRPLLRSPQCLNLLINTSYPLFWVFFIIFCLGLVFFFSCSIWYWLDLTASDMVWNTADTGWILTSIASFFDSWVFGSCIFIHNLPQTDSAVFLNTLCRFPIDILIGAPTLFRMLVQNDLSKYKFMNLKCCMSGGEPLNPEVMEQWKSQTGLDIYEVYGQTEMGIICSVFKGMKIKPGSMGKAAPLYDVQIIDKNANILPPGQQGEIAIRSKPIRPLGFFSEYVDNPKKTAETERGDFYVTGDRGTMDEEGYFHFIGRDDDIIISSGYRIGPFEVESALIEHPAVVETAVVSSPDPLRGEVVKAFVVLSPTFSSTDLKSLILELQDHVKKTTAPYKYPRKVEFVKELPKTVTGKIKRNELRDKEWGRI
ncbi:ACSM4 synthetase, partial [Regulus satrapa]|nr:ACSM4 synthetase [Regulus satrapa]